MISVPFRFRLLALLGFLIVAVCDSSSLLAQGRFKIVAEPTEASDVKEKFVELLETKDLSQFRGYQSEEIGEGWKIEGKLLVFDGTGSGDLITRESYENFELQYDWSISEGGNSGVMYHVTLGDDQPYLSGPELQILDDEKHADGKSELTSAGALYALYAPTTEKLRKVGTWNNCRLVVDGSNVTHYLNGEKAVEIDTSSEEFKSRVAASKFKDWKKFNQSPVGHVAFQNHGNAVKFRNVRIKRLPGITDSAAQADGTPQDFRPVPGRQGENLSSEPAPASAGGDK